MKLINSALIRVSRKIHSNGVLGYPEKILFEPTNACNLKCPLCPTGINALGRPTGQMRIDQFSPIIDEIQSRTKHVEFAGYGEPFIAKDIFRMIRYAAEKGLHTHVYSNLLMLNTEEKMDELISSGLNRLTVSIDGATQETYEKYRIGGNIDVLFDVLGKIIERKKVHNINSMEIVGQMLVTKQNEHEVHLMKKRTQALGLDRIITKTANLALTKPMENSSIDPLLTSNFYPTRNEFQRYRANSAILRNGCSWLYKECVIFWNGDVTTCCHDPSGINILGNVFSSGSVWSVWNGDNYKKLRKQVNHDISSAHPLCSQCPDRSQNINS
ncbi:MAG: radical SAM protein [Gammaproteobacteria bacterium]|nr:radical SAM protein [Gammaproteobacteria bacterium]MBU1656266.1 radical SAM protein [Gammaproteobacteria bacterium]MBU1959831.1 radical SAM protein [Gammaproteobacteria bacterium]